MNSAILLSSWEKVSREDLRRLLRRHTPDESVEILKREIRSGMPDDEEIELRVESASAKCMKTVIYGSENYPDVLINIPDPPVVLFYRGDIERFLTMPAIAVIGSRRCTTYGKKVARTLARDFVRSGVAVVSGLARGIDGEAHRGVIEAGGITMAVLGNGLDVCYPPEHDRLSEKILEKGVLLSEYPPGTEPARYRFPERNRLISGFSRGVVVVEAGRKSGTMITVNTALDQGRDVFAVPGEVTRALSMGTNMLLRDGAGVVITAADVLEPLGLARDQGSSAETFEPDNDTARAILEHLSIEMLHFNQLLRSTGVGTAVLQSELLSLEMAGVVAQHPGKFYSLS
jgi:DNA processing protein